MSGSPHPLDRLRGDDEAASRARVAEVRARLAQRGFSAAGAPPPRRSRVVAVAGAIAALAAAAALAFVATRPPPPLAFEVDGIPSSVGAPLVAAEHGVELRFSEGSTIELSRGASGSIASMSEHGATLRLERGTASRDIRPRPRAGWSVDVGELSVRVHGTRFSVTRAEPNIDVSVERGLVEVVLPSAESVWLHDGERYAFVPEASRPAPSTTRPDLDDDDALEVRDEMTTPASDPASSPTRRPVTDRLVLDGPIRRSSPTSDDDAPDYETLVRAGLFDDAVRRAEERGFERELERLPRSPLLALADAARFAHAPDRARRAYEAVRRRFPDSRERPMASFALGRVCADQLRDPSCAAEAFDDYLDRAPTGPLATDALGRLMEARRDAHDEAGARRAAQLYLDRHPEGPLRELARELTRSP